MDHIRHTARDQAGSGAYGTPADAHDADAEMTDGHTTPGVGTGADLTDPVTGTDGWEAGDMNPDAILP